MKTFIFDYLSIICFGIFLGQIHAKTAIDVYELSAFDRISHKLDGLKSGSDILKLQFEIMNYRFERYQYEAERKFNSLEKIMQKLVAQQNNNLGSIVDKGCDQDQSDSVANAENPEIRRELTILQNIDSKLNKLNEKYENETEKYTKSIADTYDLVDFLSNKEDSKICVRSNDEKLVCTTEPRPTSCAEYDTTHCANDKCRIQNHLYGSKSFLVTCDDTTDGGGWTIIQRRINGSVDFYRGWSEYKNGFGNLNGEFWIGLDKLHALTTTLAPVELLIQLKDQNDTLKYAKYGKFSIGSELEMYVLKEADDYEGNAGDSFGLHKGFKFTTKDKDNDESSDYNCAVSKRGAWWYKECGWANLNGVYQKTGEVPKYLPMMGIYWYHFHGYSYSMKFVQMMIRPRKA